MSTLWLRAWLGCAVALALSLAGCDLIDPGGPSYAGVVIDAETGSSIEGIQISLQVGGGFGAYSIVAEDLTDADGQFWLRDPLDRASRAILFVNCPPYSGDRPSPVNRLYNGGLVRYDFDDRHDIRIELARL